MRVVKLRTGGSPPGMSPRKEESGSQSPRARSFLRSRSGGSSKSNLGRAAAGSSSALPIPDEELRAKVLELFSDMERLRATLRDLYVRRDSVTFFEEFINSSAFQETLTTLQSLQEQQKALLGENASRVSSVCAKEYPELLRLSVDVMTLFSRVATKPGTETVEDITDVHSLERQQSVSASI